MRSAPAGRRPPLSERIQKLPALRMLCRFGRHRRARGARYRDVDGLIKSVCIRCGVRMVRERETGHWLVHGDRDRRRRTRPLRRALDQLTGPILFLMALAGAFGLILWYRGQSVLADDVPLAENAAQAQKARARPPAATPRKTP